jgi:Tol biopolymer transport system component
MSIRSFKSWAVVFVSAVLVCLSAAQDPSKYLTARDYYDLEFVSDPQISPDGNKIVYVRHFSDIMTDKRHSNLWIINFDGSGHRPLTSGNSSDFSPRWSPDGKCLIFSVNRKENWELESQDSEVHELSLADGFLKALTARWRSIGIDVPVKYSSVKVSPSRMRLIWAACC